jgi:hypothetical protein
VPEKRDGDGNALLDCSASVAPGGSTLGLEAMVYESETIGSFAYFPKDSRFIGRLNASSPSTSFTIAIRKQERWKRLSFVSVGLNAAAPASTKIGAGFELSCKLRTKLETPEFTGAQRGTNAIESYYRTIRSALGVMKAEPGKGLEEICPPCVSMHQAAAREYGPLHRAMSDSRSQVRAIQNEWRPVTMRAGMYYRQIKTMHSQVDDADRAKIRGFVEIGTMVNEVNTACVFNYTNWIDLPCLFTKGTFPVEPNWVRSQIRRYKGPIPTEAELEKEFQEIRQATSRISACGQALQHYKPLLAKRKAEAFRHLEELKAKHPTLN